MHPKFQHNVYFYPTDNAAPDAAGKLAEGCRRHLSAIPGVLRLEVGTPAGTPRDVVDNNYAVALLVELTDSAAHDVYQDHPDHHAFIAECRQYWSRVQIYDTLLTE